MTDRTARFLQGSIFRHVVVMTLTGALGLMTLFIVELADLYFLNLLGNQQITAAIGFAGTLDFANLSLSIGTGIAAVALVSRSVGAGQPQRAREFATSAMMVAIGISAIYTLVVNIFIGPILSFLGATGETAHQAKLFVWTISPGFIFLAGTLSCSFSLRGIGDAKRSMYNTLTAALVTLALDPIFIFKFGWGIQGTAAANAIAYVLSFAVGLYGLAVKQHFLVRPSWAGLKRDFPAVWGHCHALADCPTRNTLRCRIYDLCFCAIRRRGHCRRHGGEPCCAGGLWDDLFAFRRSGPNHWPELRGEEFSAREARPA